MPIRRPGKDPRMPGVSRTLSERARANRTEESASPEQASASLLDGLRGMLEKLGTLAGSLDRGEVNRQGEQSFTVDGKEGRIAFGYRVRSGLDGGETKPASSSPPPPPTAEPRQPIVDVFVDGNDVLVVAEVPGAADADIAVTLTGDHLLIVAEGSQRYRREVTLPEAVHADSLRRSCNNGILELRLQRAGVA